VAEESVEERGEQAGEPGLFHFVAMAAQDFGGDFFGGIGIAGGDQFGEGTHGDLPRAKECRFICCAFGAA
jgi:hypothetical protein